MIAPRFITIATLSILVSLLANKASAQVFPSYDKDAEVRKRMPPIMPQEADGSGYCCMAFDIDRNGVPINIKARYCTESYFEAPSKEAISRWTYSPAENNGTTVIRTGVATTMSFHLTGVFGQVIEGRTGYLSPRDISTLKPLTSKDPGAYRKWLDEHFHTETPCGNFLS